MINELLKGYVSSSSEENPSNPARLLDIDIYGD